MAEYIEREEIMNRLFTEYATDSKADVFELIRSIPAADVQPVKHGRWVCVGHDDITYWYRCSVCEHEEHDNMTKHDNYCSSCGARMDLKDGGAE